MIWSDAFRDWFRGIRTAAREALDARLASDGMGPEAVVALMQIRLRDLDGQIAQLTNDMNRRTREAEALGERLQEQRALQQEADLLGRGEHGEYVRRDEPPEGWVPPRDGVTWDDYQNALLERLRSEGITNRDAMQRRIDATNEELRQLSSGNEMRMVRLQSLMQQRTSVIQAGSNMLKALDEATDAVVANLR